MSKNETTKEGNNVIWICPYCEWKNIASHRDCLKGVFDTIKGWQSQIDPVRIYLHKCYCSYCKELAYVRLECRVSVLLEPATKPEGERDE
jgi:hypothetical protein